MVTQQKDLVKGHIEACNSQELVEKLQQLFGKETEIEKISINVQGTVYHAPKCLFWDEISFSRE